MTEQELLEQKEELLRQIESMKKSGNDEKKKISVDALNKAYGDSRSGVIAIGLPDMTATCNDAEICSLKWKEEKVDGMRVKATTGKWFSIYLSNLISDIPFSKTEDGKYYIIPDTFRMVSKDKKIMLTV